MTLLLEFKEKLKQIYANYGYAVIPVGKFLLAFIIFKSISGTLNFVESLNSIFILLILALICCIMPLNVTVFFGLALIVLQCYGVGVEVAAFALAVILIIAILFIRFAPQDAIILLDTDGICIKDSMCDTNWFWVNKKAFVSNFCRMWSYTLLSD